MSSEILSRKNVLLARTIRARGVICPKLQRNDTAGKDHFELFSSFFFGCWYQIFKLYLVLISIVSSL